jgi:hypothetical protein
MQPRRWGLFKTLLEVIAPANTWYDRRPMNPPKTVSADFYHNENETQGQSNTCVTTYEDQPELGGSPYGKAFCGSFNERESPKEKGDSGMRTEKSTTMYSKRIFCKTWTKTTIYHLYYYFQRRSLATDVVKDRRVEETI